ncbi:MAG: AraC family transcriptional regulator [Gelidibacter sp.]
MNASVTHFVPHPLLLPYIERYTLRNIGLDPNETLEKLMPHRTLTSIEFFLATPHQKFELTTKQPNSTETSTVRGFRTFSKYRIKIRQNFLSLTVKFRPSGMYGLLGIPLNHLTNEDIPLRDLNLFPVKEMETRLQKVDNDTHYRSILDDYLLKLYKQRTHKMRLQPFLSTKNYQSLHIKTIANELGVSVRQAERLFLNEVGLSFVKWRQLQKFDAAIKHKIAAPQTSWTDLAYQYHFYDQPNFNKTFKKYLGITPSLFDPADFAF